MSARVSARRFGVARLPTRLGTVLLTGLLAVALPSRPAPAQNYFGKNQVQYDWFDWRVLTTKHFEIYFYPDEEKAAHDAAILAERSYARLSRVLKHEFTQKKPIMLFASRMDFGQNNVTGDLGEGTGGVTEALRHRMLLNFTGDYRSFEHVLAHEMVHAFQYDIFARGKAGSNLRALSEFMPPLWFAEGMAEYLSLGPTSTQTDTWMRDAALNTGIPSVKQMTLQPERFFPYRYGHAFWAYVGARWGDEAIGQIMNAVPTVGFERAFKRELGMSLDDISDEWQEDVKYALLPGIKNLQPVRRMALPLLEQKKSGGEIFLAPAFSNDGKRIAFLSNGSFSRGQVFIDLWLADGETGKRIERLQESTTNAEAEELRLLYAQSAFSPDGQRIAYTVQTGGRDVLKVRNVSGSKQEKKIELALESAISPSWSPDGARIVFSGGSGGLSDLYIVDVATGKVERITDDRFADQQPQWSPDGKTIAFATDRGPEASFTLMRFPRWRIAVYDVESRAITVLAGQEGHNLNPQWAPDGGSIAYISDRTGIANLFLYDLGARSHYQLTNLKGSISAITEYSPAISWARGADRLAFTYFENGTYTIHTLSNPRGLKKDAYPDIPAVRPSLGLNVVRDSASRSVADADSSAPPISVAALLDSLTIGFADTMPMQIRPYRVSFLPEYVARPTIAYAPDNYGRNYFGGTTVILGDLLGNHHLAIAGEINGRLSESRLFLGYTNLSRRMQYSTGLSQSPYYFLSADSLAQTTDPLTSREHQEITTFVARQAFGVTAYPFNRFTRVEFGGGFNNVERRRWYVRRDITNSSVATPFVLDSIRRIGTLNYVDGQVALVSDNTLFGYTGPLLGRRYRLQVSPIVGSLNWVEYLADYRRYDPIIFNYLTLATRVYVDLAVGPNELEFPKYIGRPDFVRGYDRNNSFYMTCPVVGANPANCSTVQLLGSRVAVANVELRFPLIRRIELGLLPITLPPLDGVMFYDVGMAWSKDHTPYLSRPTIFDPGKARYPIRSYGFGLRLNLFNYAILRWDYAKPIDNPDRRGFWTWSLWPSF